MSSSTSRTDETLFNYHDAVMYRSDLQLFQSSTAWLNDACIHFHLTRLEHKRGPKNNQDLFIDPAVLSYLMHQCSDDEHEELAELANNAWKLRNKRRLFAPINDNYATSHDTFGKVGGGTHWSLLVVLVLKTKDTMTTSTTNDEQGGRGEHLIADKTTTVETKATTKTKTKTTTANANSTSELPEIIMLHFDSSHGSTNNTQAAQVVGEKIHQVFRIAYDENRDRSNNHPTNDVPIIIQCKKMPQQSNGYDCGLYALGAAEALTELMIDTSSTSTLTTSHTVSIVQMYEECVEEFITKEKEHFANLMRTRLANDTLALWRGEMKKEKKIGE